MAGFLGLGGSSDSYFLEPDDAKTMGDIDYMRTPKKVKHTFAKSKGWGDIGASEKAISAYDERGGEASAGSAVSPSYTAPSTPSYSSPASSYTPSTPSYTPPVESTPAASEAAPAPEAASEPTPAPAPKPSSSGDGMDMFRSMARKIR